VHATQATLKTKISFEDISFFAKGADTTKPVRSSASNVFSPSFFNYKLGNPLTGASKFSNKLLFD